MLNWLKRKVSNREKIRAESRVCTVTFSNMANYVGIAEAMSLSDLPNFMSTYFELQGRAIAANGGAISNIFGDNIMSCWDQADSAQLACESALDQLDALKEFGAWAIANGFPSPAMRIGINTGMMNIQWGPKPQDLLVMGDGVNLASRLDPLNKTYGSQILISEFTRAELDETFVVRAVDVVRVIGKEKPLTLYELVGRAASLDDDARKFLSVFETAFTKYQAADFSAAMIDFQFAHERRPSDAATILFISRCEELLKFPPGQPWDGVKMYRV